MEGSVKLSDFKGQLIEIYTFNVHEGERDPYAIMDIIPVQTGEEVKTRTSSKPVIDRMTRAIAAGAVLPVSAHVVEKIGGNKRPYLTLE